MYIDIDQCVESMNIDDFNHYFYKVESDVWSLFGQQNQ
jgi:hypothetical protein